MPRLPLKEKGSTEEALRAGPPGGGSGNLVPGRDWLDGWGLGPTGGKTDRSRVGLLGGG